MTDILYIRLGRLACGVCGLPALCSENPAAADEEWADAMAYCRRRSAARARGDHPGKWIPQHVRRPDLDAEGGAIVAGIIARRHADEDPDGNGQLVEAEAAELRRDPLSVRQADLPAEVA